MNIVRKPQFDSSGGVQGATSWLLRATNEVESSTNARFNDTVGAIIRRNGFVKEGSVVQANKPGLGIFEFKASTGSKIFTANNNSGDTATIVKGYDKGTGNWTSLSLPTALPANMKIQMDSSLDEMYIAGKIGTTFMQPVNVKNDLTTSETRSLLFAPKAKFICEFSGSLYLMNVQINGVSYPDRAYKSSPALGVITYTRGAQNTDSTQKLLVDSARYLKPTMSIDIYNHLTQTARYTNLVIASVDKATDTIVLPAITPITFATSAVNTSTDVITLSSTTSFPTGTPITFTSTTLLPAPLQSSITYYAINLTGTTMKVAATTALATAGTAIDITSTGTGTHSIYTVYTVDDNDEIWLSGRYGEQYYLWNTDYPNFQQADYLKIPSGASNNSEIIGWGESNNRLFLFTDSTTHKWDGQNFITRFNTIGLAAYETVKNIGDWLLWLDSEKRVIAYNDSTGQQEFISKGVYTKYLKNIPGTQLLSASAGTSENMYKLCVGSVNNSILRLNYDFDSNTWAPDTTTVQMTQHVISKMSGSTRLYFMGSDGQLYLDDEGDFDGISNSTIPFRVKFGKRTYDSDLEKDLTGYKFFGENMSGAVVRVYVDEKEDPIKLGQLTNNISKIAASNTQPVHGSYFNLEVSLNSNGSPIVINGYDPFYSVIEDKF